MLKRTLSMVLILGIMLALIAAAPFHAEHSIVVAPGTDFEPLLGDADSNGSVDIADATAIQRHLADIPLPFWFDLNLADADEDGYITVLDVTNEQRWIAGIVANENIGKPADILLDKNTAQHYSGTQSGHFKITQICANYFYGQPVTPIMPFVIKIHGRLDDMWCVGDQVYCVYNNIYADETFWYAEGCLVSIGASFFEPDPYVAYKPVIYLYPEQETEVSVQLDLNGEFLTTYPEYKDGWTVTAAPDGTLTDGSGRTYPYLFWEGKLNADYDLSKGFCVKGADTESFLRDKLAVLGLNEKEIADFTEFWLSFMEKNPYNVISFQTEAYTDAAKLNISPAPDALIRVFMTWYPSDEAVEIPAQELTPAGRSGFTAVEWGGQMIG